jgi:hypothetical protein
LFSDDALDEILPTTPTASFSGEARGGVLREARGRVLR